MQQKINLRYWKTVEKVEVEVHESMSMNALVEKLQQAFDQLFGYINVYPDDFTVRTTERMSRFVEVVVAEQVSEVSRELDAHEVKTLEHCANNLIMLARQAYAHYREVNQLKPVTGSTKNKNNFFQPASEINKPADQLSQNIVDAIMADEVAVIEPFLTNLLAYPDTGMFAKFITALVRAEYNKGFISLKINIRENLFVAQLLKNKNAIERLLDFDLGVWFMLTFHQGIEIFKVHPDLIDKINLNAAPVRGDYQGETIALILAKSPEGRSIFDAQPALLEKCHLDVRIGKQRTIGEHLLFSRSSNEAAISEPLLQKLLTVYGLDAKASCDYITSPNIVKMIEAYRQAFSLAEKGEFAGLEELLQKMPWLCDIKKAETGDTLLHVIIQSSMFDKSMQEACVNKFEKLFTQLQPLQRIENKSRFLPVDYANDSILLQHRFSAYQSDLEKEFNLLFQANIDLFCDVLSGVGGVGVLVERLAQIIAEFSSAIEAAPHEFVAQTKGAIQVLTDLRTRAENDRPTVKKFGVMFPMRYLSDAEEKTLAHCVKVMSK